MFQCAVFGGGVTVWNSTSFDCHGQGRINEIRLRHSDFGDNVDSPAFGSCNHGAVIAQSVEVLNNCYISHLIVTVGKEMINGTIECSYDSLRERVTIGQKSLLVTQIPYPPPSNIYIKSNDSSEIIFAWDEVIAQCSSLQYIITAINCGLCPNITTDKNVTCDLQSDISQYTNNTCLFAVQTEVCGHLHGERNDYVLVHIQFGHDQVTSAIGKYPM